MSPTESPATSPTAAQSSTSISTSPSPKCPPLLTSLTFKRWGSARKPKRGRVEDDSDSGEVLNRVSSREEMDMDWSMSDGAEESMGMATSVPVPRPILRARSGKVKIGRRVENFGPSSAPELSRAISLESEPSAKRQRQRSGSTSSTSSLSGVTGLLVSETETVPCSPQTPAAPIPDVPARAASTPRGALYVPSPLATAPIVTSPSSITSSQSSTMSETLPEPLSASGQEEIDVVTTAAQVKARAFWRDVEDLGAELGNVLRLGLGRGLGRGTSHGQRRPSRLRSSLVVDNKEGDSRDEMEAEGLMG